MLLSIQCNNSGLSYQYYNSGLSFQFYNSGVAIMLLQFWGCYYAVTILGLLLCCYNSGVVIMLLQFWGCHFGSGISCFLNLFSENIFSYSRIVAVIMEVEYIPFQDLLKIYLILKIIFSLFPFFQSSNFYYKFKYILLIFNFSQRIQQFVFECYNSGVVILFTFKLLLSSWKWNISLFRTF